MKKTTTIHLSGILFHIEEDAFNLLHEYLQSIEAHFNQNKNRQEIIEDIENRIAEIFTEKLHNNKQVITHTDVQEMINTLGRVEDFDSAQENNSNTEHISVKKRFYRNPDDKVIGGVCSGIAAYFDIDPLWIRLAWAISFFVFGTGLLFYILLWIIIPEAKTASQKLEMRGEKINISNISKGMSDDINNFAKNASKEFSKSGNKILAFIQNIIQYLLNFIYTTGKGLMKFFAVLFMIISAFILMILFVITFGDTDIYLNSKHFNISHSLSDFFTHPFQSILFSISLFFVIGIPLILLITNLIKFIFNIKRKVKYAGLVALILWLTGWGLLAYSTINAAETFSEKSYNTTQFTQYIPSGKTLYIKMTEDDENPEDEMSIKLSNKILYSSNDNKASFGFPYVVVKKSKDDSIRIKIIRSARSENIKQAKMFANNIDYEINWKDSILELSSKYDIPKDDKFHFQRVKIIVEIPQNRYVYLSANLKHYLADAENNINADEEDMTGKKWLMGIDHLQCIESCDEMQNTHTKQHKKHKKDEEDYEESNEN